MTDAPATCRCLEPEKFGHDVTRPHKPIANAPLTCGCPSFDYHASHAECMKSDPAARAREIVAKFEELISLSGNATEWLNDHIATALVAERKAGYEDSRTYSIADAECYRRGIEEGRREIREACSQHQHDQYSDGFKAAIEEAAKVVDHYGPNAGLSESAWAMPNVLTILADRIRQLGGER